MTLYRYIKKRRTTPDDVPVRVGYAKPSRIFSEEKAQELSKYVEDCSKVYYGLTTKDLRKLAYNLENVNRNKIPDSWKNKEIASKDWLLSFLKSNQNLSIGTPELSGISRATAFNRENVNLFLQNCPLFTKNTPISHGSYYYNYKGSNSIVLLGLTDAHYRFIYVNIGIGVNGRISDGGIFHNTKLSEALDNNSINLPEPELFITWYE
mgnify:CR=1 FL=1